MADHRPDPAEPEPCCVTPWRPTPSLNGGASLQIPDAARKAAFRASHPSQSGTQLSPRFACRFRARFSVPRPCASADFSSASCLFGMPPSSIFFARAGYTNELK